MKGWWRAVVEKTKEGWRWLRSTFGVREVHVYGGVLVMVAALWTVDRRLSMGVLGASLFYLGAFWGRRPPSGPESDRDGT